jgi:hypothetical protein
VVALLETVHRKHVTTDRDLVVDTLQKIISCVAQISLDYVLDIIEPLESIYVLIAFFETESDFVLFYCVFFGVFGLDLELFGFCPLFHLLFI